MTDITNAPAPTAPTAGTPAPAPATPPAGDPAQLSLPVASPAPAPVATPAPIPASQGDGSTVAYEATGDAGLDVALKFVGDRGLAADHPAMVAARTGDFHLLRATLATMGDKAVGFESMVALAEQAFIRTSESTKARQTQDLALVHSIAGGEEGWKAVREWAGKEASPEEKAGINAALAQGGVAARMAATYLTSLFTKATGASGEMQGLSAVKDGVGGAPTTGALSPSDYTKAVAELARTSRVPLNENPKYAELRSRRAQYQGQ